MAASIEWAVWAHLDSETNLELILLKGHLLLEVTIGCVLARNNVADYESYSFYRKIIALTKIEFRDTSKQDFIVSSLIEINRLRNRLAQEFHFDMESGNLNYGLRKFCKI